MKLSIWLGCLMAIAGVGAANAAVVSGKIDSAGSAKLVSGAIVTLRSSGGGGGATTLRDTTGADGAYSFDTVTAGVYTLGVSATGYTTKSVIDTVTAAPKTTDVSLVAIVTSTVSGKVDSAGSAKLLSGAIVTLTRTGAGGTTSRDTTGADGIYSFEKVIAGTYTISVAATGYTTTSVIDTVTAAPKTTDVSLVAIVTSTVTGKVDSAGSAKLLSGAIVTLTRTGAGGTTSRDTTGADGIYSFEKVIAGTYTISVAATGYTTTSVIDTVTAAPKTTDVSLVAIITSTVTGKVDSAGSTKLLDGAIVTLTRTGAGGTTSRDTTGADGIYSFEKVIAGTYTISVAATGYTTKSVIDTVTAAPKTTDVSLVAIVTSTVSGKVDSAGSAKLLSGAIVTLTRTGAGGTTSRDTTGADGIYSFEKVIAGTYTISVAATGYTTKSVIDTVTAAPNTANVSLIAIITSTVTGKVDSAGSTKLVSGAIVTLTRTGAGGTTSRDTTGADGIYSFEKVIAGTYTISVAATGYTTKSVIDTVTAAPNTANVSLVAVVTSSVSGKVDSAGSTKLLSGAIVTLRSFGAGGGATTLRDTTGADGTYSFEKVTAGIYTISVTAAGYTAKSVNDTVNATPKTVNVSLVVAGPAKTINLSDAVSNATFANGVLRLTNLTSEGSVRLYNANGELMVVRSFQPGATVDLQIGSKLSMGNYILRITQKDVVLQKWIVVP